MAHLHPSETGGRLAGFADRCVDREPMVVAGDLDPPGGNVDHRLVDAAVAKRQLVGSVAEGSAEQLVAKADSEEGQTLTEHGLEQLHMRVGCTRVAGAVGEEDRARLEGEQVGEGDLLWDDMHVEAARGQVPQRRGLHPEVEHRHRADAVPLRRDRVSHGSGDRAGEVRPGHPGRGADKVQLVGLRQGGIRSRENTRAHHACVAEPTGDRSCVDSADADDVLRGEIVIEAAVGAMVGHHP